MSDDALYQFHMGAPLMQKEKIIKSQPLIKHKHSNHTVWKTPSADHEGNNSKKKGEVMGSKNVFVLISLSGLFIFFTPCWQLHDIFLALISHCTLKFQWPQNGGCFPPLVWRAWLWPATHRGGLIRLLFTEMMKYLPDSFTQWSHWKWKTSVVGDLLLPQALCKYFTS